MGSQHAARPEVPSLLPARLGLHRRRRARRQGNLRFDEFYYFILNVALLAQIGGRLIFRPPRSSLAPTRWAWRVKG